MCGFLSVGGGLRFEAEGGVLGLYVLQEQGTARGVSRTIVRAHLVPS